MKKIIWILLLIILIGIQFIRPVKNMSTVITRDDITAQFNIPDPVLDILQRSCYDCHSNSTRYPWYNQIQPVAWWLNRHVQEGKQELNFSEFGSYTIKKATRKLAKIAKTTKGGSMPLDAYLWIHTDAKLSASDIQVIGDWAKGLADSLTTNFGPDSLRVLDSLKMRTSAL
jgi:hypothetical protein